MEITIKKEALSFEEFLFEERHQAIVEFPNRYYKELSIFYFLVKVNDENGTLHVYGKYLYNSDPRLPIDLKDLSVIASINHEAKYIIAYDAYCIDAEAISENAAGYRVITVKNLILEISCSYKDMFDELMDENISKIRKTEAYKKAYNEKQGQANYYKENARNLFLKDEDLTYDYRVKFLTESYNDSSFNSKVASISLFHEHLMFLDTTKALAIANFEEDYLIEDIANVDFYREMVAFVLSNPDTTMKISKAIRAAIAPAGKTLKVKIKTTNQIIQVDNRLVNGCEFRHTTGYERTEISSIDEIYFRGKVIYKAQE